MNALENLTVARSLLVLDHCFWGLLVMRLKWIEEPLCPTLATDGVHLYYNPKYIDTLTIQELIGVEAHEVMHAAMGDIWRCGEKDINIWRIACDYVNNLILLDAGFTLPGSPLVNEAYADKSKEEVYQMLIKQNQSQGQSQGQSQNNDQNKDNDNKYDDPGKCGTFIKPSSSSSQQDETSKQTEVGWKAAVVQAAQLSKGDIPANLHRMVNDEILDPPLPWYVILRDFVEHTARNDYNWTRPNKRFLSSDIYLPGIISDELPSVVVAIDTSGSIDDETLQRFCSEASAILGCYKTHVHVLSCDAFVHSHVEYDTEDLPISRESMNITGGGGTDFQPVFREVDDKGITPSCLIYLTDLMGTFPNKEPSAYPTIWVSTDRNEKAPWGITIPMDI